MSNCFAIFLTKIFALIFLELRLNSFFQNSSKTSFPQHFFITYYNFCKKNHPCVYITHFHEKNPKLFFIFFFQLHENEEKKEGDDSVVYADLDKSALGSGNRDRPNVDSESTEYAEIRPQN